MNYNSKKTITIDNKEVFKATVLKQIFSSAPLSKNRLKRVRGIDRNVNEDSHGALEDVMYIGGPVLVKKVNTSVKSYHLNEHSSPTLQLDLL